MRDKGQKGRNPGNRTSRGGHPRKLDPIDIAAGRLAGQSFAQIGERLGVSAATALRTLRRIDERNADLARERIGMWLTVETAPIRQSDYELGA